jgi:flavin reductase (DIM6/NTAB) family NADH-FMN oxidoreductase RutF/DNA-binding IclR family transcriptional regulator
MAADTSFDDNRFREVLGHLPTGVVVITAMKPDGQPAGMAVGSFTSVSLDPPLVAFLPARTSSSFPSIREASSFCVNVLSAKQEVVCRQFAVSGGDKFSGLDWTPSPSGAPLLDGVVAWIDCEFERVDEAGDHYIVLGRVTNLGTGVPTLPLLFFQGGYGGFAPTSLAMGATLDMLGSLAIADRARQEIEALAADVGFECHAQVLRADQIVLVASGYPPQSAAVPWRIGLAMPVVPPWGEAFMAWRPVAEQTEWLERTRTPAESRARIIEDMAMIKSAGWSMTVWRSMADIDHISDVIAEHGRTPATERKFAELMQQAGTVARVGSEQDLPKLTDYPADSILSISAPVFSPDGELELMVNIHNMAIDTPEAEVKRCIHELREAAARISGRLS